MSAVRCPHCQLPDDAGRIPARPMSGVRRAERLRLDAAQRSAAPASPQQKSARWALAAFAVTLAVLGDPRSLRPPRDGIISLGGARRTIGYRTGRNGKKDTPHPPRPPHAAATVVSSTPPAVAPRDTGSGQSSEIDQTASQPKANRPRRNPKGTGDAHIAACRRRNPGNVPERVKTSHRCALGSDEHQA